MSFPDGSFSRSEKYTNIIITKNWCLNLHHDEHESNIQISTAMYGESNNQNPPRCTVNAITEKQHGGTITLISENPTLGTVNLLSKNPPLGTVNIISDNPALGTVNLLSENPSLGTVNLLSEIHH